MYSVKDNGLMTIGFSHSEISGLKLIYQLTEAYRRLSRPSSPSNAKASVVCTYSLDHITPKYLSYIVSYFTKKSQIEINLNRWILFLSYFTSGFYTANENPYFLKLLCQCNTPMITVITTVIALLYCIFTNFTSCIKLLKSSKLESLV